MFRVVLDDEKIVWKESLINEFPQIITKNLEITFKTTAI